MLKIYYTKSSITEGIQSCHRSKWYLTAFNISKEFLSSSRIQYNSLNTMPWIFVLYNRKFVNESRMKKEDNHRAI